MTVNFEGQRELRAWLNTLPGWRAKRPVFIVVGPHGVGKSWVLRAWARETPGATYVNVNAELIARAFPQDGPDGLLELGRDVNAPFVARELGRAFRDLAGAQTADVVILDHAELLLDYRVEIEPQSVLGELGARTGRRFVLVLPGHMRGDVVYVRGRDRFHWRRGEAQFLEQYFELAAPTAVPERGGT